MSSCGIERISRQIGNWKTLHTNFNSNLCYNYGAQ